MPFFVTGKGNLDLMFCSVIRKREEHVLRDEERLDKWFVLFCSVVGKEKRRFSPLNGKNFNYYFKLQLLKW